MNDLSPWILPEPTLKSHGTLSLSRTNRSPFSLRCLAGVSEHKKFAEPRPGRGGKKSSRARRQSTVNCDDAGRIQLLCIVLLIQFTAFARSSEFNCSICRHAAAAF